MAKKPQPKPPPRAGGGARSAGHGTLAQATGGKPGKVQSAAPVKKSLGLGLGLGARQRGNFQQAVQGGTGGQWLGNHPGVQQRIGQINPNSAAGGQQQARIQNFMGSGQSQKPPQPPTTQRQPRGAQQMGQQPQAPLQMPNYHSQQPPMQGNFAQGTGDRLNQGTMGGYPTGTMGGQQQIADQNGRGQMGGWSGDNAGQQSQLGQQGAQYGQQAGGQQGGGLYGAMASMTGYGGPNQGAGQYGGAANDQNAINADPQGFQRWQQGYAQQGGQSQFGGGGGGNWSTGAQGQPQYNGPNMGGAYNMGGQQGGQYGGAGSVMGGQQGSQYGQQPGANPSASYFSMGGSQRGQAGQGGYFGSMQPGQQRGYGGPPQGGQNYSYGYGGQQGSGGQPGNYGQNGLYSQSRGPQLYQSPMNSSTVQYQ